MRMRDVAVDVRGRSGVECGAVRLLLRNSFVSCCAATNLKWSFFLSYPAGAGVGSRRRLQVAL
jgi:hypothetical protein